MLAILQSQFHLPCSLVCHMHDLCFEHIAAKASQTELDERVLEVECKAVAHAVIVYLGSSSA